MGANSVNGSSLPAPAPQPQAQSANSHDAAPKSIWHPDKPGLQVVWDATSLTLLQSCAYRYKLAQVDGWRTPHEAIDLSFGRVAGECLELFYRGIIEGKQQHDEALAHALRHALETTWDYDADKPRWGEFGEVWRCTGTEPFRTASGRKGKCPFAWVNKMYMAPAPATCGRCGSPTQTWLHWFPEHPVKDRLNLLRLIVSYAEEVKGGLLKPASMYTGDDPDTAQHMALVEVHAMTNLGFSRRREYTLYVSAWFDSIKTIEHTESYVCDYKTTKGTLDERYFSQYDPNTQVWLYDWIASEVLPEALNYQGVAIEAIQILKGGTRYGLRMYKRTAEQRREMWQHALRLAHIAEMFHQTGTYPRNLASCGRCQFRRVCAAEPVRRDAVLREHYIRARWNPLTRKQEPVGESATTDHIPPAPPPV